MFCDIINLGDNMNNVKGFLDSSVDYYSDINNLENGGYLIEVKANSDAGFNYPYLLFIPKYVNVDSTIIVEGANTSSGAIEIKDNISDKDLILKSVEATKDYFKNGHPIKRINEQTVNYPFLYPLFPRLRYRDKTFYNHMLSSNSMFIKKYDNDLEYLGISRTDLQLIEMIKDAQSRLKEYGINVEDKVIMYGFSSSAKFVNRFTLLHPEIVKCAFAAGLGGTVTLPLRELNGEKLLWPIGIGNIDEIDDEKLKLFRNVPQFYFQGMFDKVDSYQPNSYGTCINQGILEDDEAVQMYRLLGKNMNEDRWDTTTEIISSIDCSITLKSCENDHRPHMLNDIIEEIFNELSKNKSL
jgi:hypothetical protein